MLKYRLRPLIASLAAFLLNACGGGSGGSSTEPTLSTQLSLEPVAVKANDTGLPAGWYRDAVFAEIYVRGYQDSNGDGTGDIQGLISRLDYLQSLGVKGLWLMPAFKSGEHDHGYDVTDYRSIETEFGSEADLKQLLDAAHARGMGVVLDYVMNHSSSQNALFHDSTYSLADKRDWYVWNRTPPNWGLWFSLNYSYYYSAFVQSMPDFNLTNETVVQYHFNSMQKWLNLGVDGFRMDAVSTYIEDNDNQDNTPRTLALLSRVRQTVDQYPNRFMVCEDGSAPTLAVKSGCTSAFYFGLHWALVGSAQNGKVDPALAGYLTDPQMANMSTLLANHDTYFGIRLYDQFKGDEARYKLAAASLLTLPGTPFIYYGEELGLSMSSGAGAITDHQLRPPMSWTSAPVNAGFSTAKPFRALADNAATHNVELESQDPNSLLSTYKALIALRNAEPALRQGSLTLLNTGNDAVLAYTRIQGDQTLLVVINYASSPQTVTLTLPVSGTWSGRYPASDTGITVDNAGKVTLTAAATSATVHKAPIMIYVVN